MPLHLQDLRYPTHLFDLMTLCWSHDPADRPSATEIVRLASTPEFSNLYEAVPLEARIDVSAVCAAPHIVLDNDDDDVDAAFFGEF